MKMTKTPTTKVGVVITNFLNDRQVTASALGELSGISACTVTSYRTGDQVLKPDSKHVRKLAVAMNQPYKSFKALAREDTATRAKLKAATGGLSSKATSPRAATGTSLEAKVDTLSNNLKALMKHLGI